MIVIPGQDEHARFRQSFAHQQRLVFVRKLFVELVPHASLVKVVTQQRDKRRARRRRSRVETSRKISATHPILISPIPQAQKAYFLIAVARCEGWSYYVESG